MSRRRKERNRKAKEGKVKQQRNGVPSDDFWTGVRYKPLSDRGYPSVQRLEADSQSFTRKMVGNQDASCTFICKGFSADKKTWKYPINLDTSAI